MGNYEGSDSCLLYTSEDKPDTASLHSHLRNLIFDLSHTLEDAGVNGLLVRGRSTLALRCV